jgi:hypothetical protein
MRIVFSNLVPSGVRVIAGGCIIVGVEKRDERQIRKKKQVQYQKI